jgi:hypothetical protein
MVVDSPTANLRAKSVKWAGASPLTRTASVRIKAHALASFVLAPG